LDGQGDFSNQKIIDSNTDNPQSVFTGDLDGDGDIDVLSASWGDDKIAWYENLSPLSVNENTSLDFSVYPIPTTGILTVKSQTNVVQIEIFNNLGQLILSNSLQNTIDISNVSQGIYFIKIKDENGNIGTKKVVKK